MSERMRSMTITEFLLARIAEDEKAAREWYGTGTVADRRDDFWLAECEAKRRIVKKCADIENGFLDCPHALDADDMLRELASVYADHPDFDDSWRATAEST